MQLLLRSEGLGASRTSVESVHHRMQELYRLFAISAEIRGRRRGFGVLALNS